MGPRHRISGEPNKKLVDTQTTCSVIEDDSEAGESESQHFRCTIERKGGLQARRAPETTEARLWDLSVAGRYKRGSGTTLNRNIRHAIIEFETGSGK